MFRALLNKCTFLEGDQSSRKRARKTHWKKKKNEKHIAIDIYKDELLLYYIFIMKYSK